MAIRVRDKDGNTIKYEAYFVDRMVDLTKVTGIEEPDDDDSLLFYTTEEKDGKTVMTAQHWNGLPTEARDKMLAIARKWLATNEAGQPRGKA